MQRKVSARSLFQSTAHPKAGGNTHGTYVGLLFQFQSTAHPKAGGNRLRFLVQLVQQSFQSTAHPKAGGNDGTSGSHRGAAVSIHRPPEGRRKLGLADAVGRVHSFQSTAHPKAGGNECPMGNASPSSVSIHRPPEGRRKPPSPRPALADRRVSIHRPPEGRRKRDAKAMAIHLARFNPPPTRRQAETLSSRRGRALPSFNPPPTRRQAETRSRAAASNFRRFNPPPTRRQAETSQQRPGQPDPRVSIHRPPEGRRKRAGVRVADAVVPFQSTAHPKAGGNPSARSTFCPLRAFQSTAHPKAGGNEQWACIAGYGPQFQSTAHPKAGGNWRRGGWYAASHAVSIHRPPEGRRKQFVA